MTGIIVAEKSLPPAEVVGQPPKRRSQRSYCKAVILSAVLSAIVTTCLATTVFMAIFWTSQSSNDKSNQHKEWVSWTRVKDGKVLHESVLFDVEAKTGLMVSAESYKIGEDNSIALHDFNKGIVAIRDFRTNTCYVSNITIPDFHKVKMMVEDRRGKQLPIQELKQAFVRPTNMTAQELGPKLTRFCDGVESHWFDVSNSSETCAVYNLICPEPPEGCDDMGGMEQNIDGCVHFRFRYLLILGKRGKSKRGTKPKIPPHTSCIIARLQFSY